MTRQDINQALLQSSFLDGANASYVEALQAKYERDPNSVEPGWREFFDALGDDPASVEKTAKGASWKRAKWPVTPSDEITNALDGDWPVPEKAGCREIARQDRRGARRGGASEEAIHRATVTPYGR